MSSSAGDLPWLAPHQAFPPASHAWPAGSAAPGLLAAGGVLDVATLCQAYRHGIFPWFSDDQPILWWSPDPRMILKTSQLRMHRSLRQAVQQFRRSPGCEIRIDSGWVIKIGRGLDFFQKPGGWVEVGANDLSLRMCLESQVDIFRA